MISSPEVRTWHKILESLALQEKGYLNQPPQNQGPTVQPNGNVIVDTIYRTAEHADSYRY
ncbi:hypothetical protein D9B87_09650 [Corynebacterium diphtheriae]|nr:hypothetical protein D9B42_09920 [Corynebacterium diphtheriae]RKW83776.1 hypothetical protein D9D07_09935 [Corynebacterium diphtheriae]RKW87709.1 hypothetical protein D9B87_09650 [Corynebacterium diphtheriae]RKX01695.1 hypothetical protein D9B99_11435 [Corynebacterium diphtheriae]UJL52247.1 hypothetical protein FE381_10075 [Corynebacterium diphtheriae]